MSALRARRIVRDAFIQVQNRWTCCRKCTSTPEFTTSTSFPEVRPARSQGCRARYNNSSPASQIVAALKLCSKVRDLESGKKLHQEAVSAGLHKNNYVAATLITMYSKCRSMPLARQVFDGLIHRDVVTWNSLILGYVQNGKSTVAMDLFTSMDCEPTSVTYVAALKACGGLASEKEFDKQACLEKGIAIHKQAEGRGFGSDMFLQSSLVDMYSKCSSMDHAKQVFDKMISKDVVTWNTLIMGYVQNGQNSIAIDLFSRMECQPDAFTYAAVLKACGGLAGERESEKHFCLEMGGSILKQVRDRRFENDMVLASSLVDMYSKCRCMDRAREVFDRMVRKDVVTWTSLILGYVQNGESLVALDLFAAMDCKPNAFTYVAALKACRSLASENDSEVQFCLEKGMDLQKQIKERGFDSDIYVGNTLVDLYSKCGSMDQAKEVFDGMACKDAITWTSLIQGYVQNGEALLALDLFAAMDCAPSSVTYVAALKACGCLASERESEKQLCLEKGMAIHKQVTDCGFESDIIVANTLVDMYSKCGSMHRAREVLDKMESKTVVSWNSVILGYVQNGESRVAMELFNRMDCEPDPFTYVAALKACGSLAALAAGQAIHARICASGIEQDVVVATSLMDFYGKCGILTKAEELFNNMQSPDMVSWNSLISGYASLANSTKVFSLVRKMQEAGVQVNGITFISILAACSHAGLVEEGKLYFESMPKFGISPSVEHYNCMVDMLGRANRLHQALDLVNAMPFEATSVTWVTLLGACRKWKNQEVGKVAFDVLIAAGKTEAAIYGSLNMWQGMDELAKTTEEATA